MATKELEREEARRIQRLRESPKYKEAKAKFDRMAEDAKREIRAEADRTTANDVINESEAAYKSKRRLHELPPHVSYIHTCQNCHHPLPEPCPSRPHEYISRLSWEIVIKRPFDCPHCGKDPRQASPDALLTVGRSFTPYHDVSLGKDAKTPQGVRYVKGKGHWIPSEAKGREFADMNGREWR